MNRIGIHYAYWQRDWNTDFIESVRHAASLGFEAVDFATADIMALPRPKQAELRDTAKGLGIALSFLPATGPDVDIASPDRSIRENGVEYFKRCVQFTADMGSDIFAGIIYSAWQARVEGILNDKSDALERSRESLRKILPTAEDCGVWYCLEVVNRYEQYLLNTAEEGIAYVDSLNSPRLKLLLDTFHMNIEEDDIPGAIRRVGGRLAHFHVGEPNRRLPGQGKDGRMPWKGIFTALRDVGYIGIITMEPFVRMGGQVGKAICVWRDLQEGPDEALDADARISIGFLRSQLAAAQAGTL